jgi:hypothetical protein
MQALAALSDPGEDPDAAREGSPDIAPRSALRAIHEARDVPPRPAPPRPAPSHPVLPRPAPRRSPRERGAGAGCAAR